MKKNLLIWIPLAALAVNGGGYLIVTKWRASKATATGVTSGVTTEPAAVSQGDRAKEESAMARRAAGLAALEARDYDKALINFTEARSLIGEKANVSDLLRVTDDLRNRARSPTPTSVGPAPTPLPSPPAPTPFRVAARSGARFSPPTVARTVDPSPPEPVATETPPAAGLLLVTTTPRGLLVQVDGSTVDLTPMRTSVRAGVHRVALFDGDRKLYETTVTVNEGSAATVLKDLSAEMGGASPRSALVAAPPTDEEPNRLAAAVTTSALPTETSNSLAGKPPTVAAATSGNLDITSPGLYGMIWVNGRPWGFPPLQARDLPLGPTKIEVRVNGVEKRSTTVVVSPGITTSVKLR